MFKALVCVGIFCCLLDAQPTGTAVSAGNLVRLNVTVAGKSGLITGLPREAFTVFENGLPQTIESFESGERPVSIGLLMDDSGSMRDHTPLMNAAALALLRLLNARNEVFVIHFNDRILLSQDFTTDLDDVTRALSQSKPLGRTVLRDACLTAATHLVLHARNPDRILIILSDGNDTASKISARDLIGRLIDNGVVVYCLAKREISLRRSSAEPSTVEVSTLADSTGGIAYVVGERSNPAHGVTMIADAIRSSYVIKYSSSAASNDSKFRRIQVKADVPGQKVQVHVRSGYHPVKHASVELITAPRE